MTSETRQPDDSGAPVLNRPGPVLVGTPAYAAVDAQIGDIVLHRPVQRGWLFGLALSFAFVMLLLYAVTYLLLKGVGIWGVNVPVAWGFAIANFVWWIGIGHAGTLISAILLLLKQQWRTSINRFAEAMTLFAVACAGLFPLIHLGRPWDFYWLIPYPNTMSLWPQFRSPLVWDFFAVSTYLTVSLLFWFLGMVPDLRALYDQAKAPWKKFIYGVLSLGWRGDAVHWKYYNSAYYLLAALATPLVVSVHSIVSLDFAAAIVPGWHSTIFPPYFVAGAILSGFAMVLTLAIPLRRFYHLENLVTLRHLENCAKVMLVTGSIVGYGYCEEALMAWYSGDLYEKYMMVNRMLGSYGFLYWLLIFCNVLAVQSLWWRKARVSIAWLFVLSLIVQLGMWTERVMIVVQSLHRDFLPSSWKMYYPTIWDWATLTGTIGLFFALFFLFIRVLPMISISEVQELSKEEQEKRQARAETAGRQPAPRGAKP